MGSRAYRRDSNGKFAGAGGGTKVTYGKAGGFASPAFRAKIAGQKASSSKSLGATAGTKGRLKPISKGLVNATVGAKGSSRRRASKGLAVSAAGTAASLAAASVTVGRINPRGNTLPINSIRGGAVMVAIATASARGTGQAYKAQRRARPTVASGRKVRR